MQEPDPPCYSARADTANADMSAFANQRLEARLVFVLKALLGARERPPN
jgi:hypothetical protein